MTIILTFINTRIQIIFNVFISFSRIIAIVFSTIFVKDFAEILCAVISSPVESIYKLSTSSLTLTSQECPKHICIVLAVLVQVISYTLILLLLLLDMSNFLSTWLTLKVKHISDWPDLTFFVFSKLLRAWITWLITSKHVAVWHLKKSSPGSR